MTRTENNLVDGTWVPAMGDRWIPVLDPADGTSVVARVPEMEAADIDAVLSAALDGFHRWRAISGPDRGDVLRRAAALLRERIDTISADLVAEMGKTTAEATGEVERAADFFEFYSGFGRSSVNLMM